MTKRMSISELGKPYEWACCGGPKERHAKTCNTEGKCTKRDPKKKGQYMHADCAALWPEWMQKRFVDCNPVMGEK